MDALPTGPDDVPISRRGVLAGVTTAAVGGGGLLALTSDPVSADVALESFELSGDSAALSDPPARVDVDIAGTFDVQMANGPPEAVRLTTQARVGPEPLVDDIGSETRFETASGSFSGVYDLLSHNDVDASMLMPDAAGGTKTTQVVVRLVASVIDGGSIAAEAWEQDSAELVVNHDGVVAVVGGEGSLSLVV